MDRADNKHLDFVLRHYEPGKFDTRRAIRRIAPRRQPSRWRQWAVAASVSGLLIISAYAAYVTLGADSTGTPAQTPVTQQPATTTPATAGFHFDNTPLPEVLRQLGSHYGVTLSATDTTRRLTGDFEATDSLQPTLRLIEQALDVSISTAE